MTLATLFQTLYARTAVRQITSRSGRRTDHAATKARAVTETLEKRMVLSTDPGWVFGLGTGPTDIDSAVEVGPGGDIYVLGSFNSETDFDPDPTNQVLRAPRSEGGLDGFVARYTPAHELVWVETFEGRGRRMILDESGSVFVAGSFTDSQAHFGNQRASLSGTQDAFVAKIDQTNVNDVLFAWVRTTNGPGVELARDLALDGLGSLYVGGNFSDTVDFDPGASRSDDIQTSFGGDDAFIWKIDHNGLFQWSKAYGAGGAKDRITAVTTDDSDSVYVHGHFFDTVSFGTQLNLTNTGTLADQFLLKLDESGDEQWVRHMSSPGATGRARIDSDGTSIYITGDFWDSLSLFDHNGHAVTDSLGDPVINPVATNKGERQDTYIAKWNSNGQLLWSEGLEGTGTSKAHQVRAAPDGNVYVVGQFDGLVDFNIGTGQSELVGIGGFILQLDSDGGFGTVEEVDGNMADIAVQSDGTQIVKGTFSGTVEFPIGELLVSSSPGEDTFVMKRVPALSANDPPTVVSVRVSGTDWSTGPQVIAAGTGAQQLSPVPFTGVDQIRIVFSEDVTVAEADLVVTGTGTSAHSISGFSYDPSVFTATWTLRDPIGAEHLLLTLNGSNTVKDSSGNALDGEWDNPVDENDPESDAFPSGDGAPGGGFAFRLNLLPGDVNGDGGTNIIDTFAVFNMQGNRIDGSNSRFDVNRDGLINIADTFTVFNNQGLQLLRANHGSVRLPTTESTLNARETEEELVIDPVAADEVLGYTALADEDDDPARSWLEPEDLF